MSKGRKILLIATSVVLVLGLAVAWVIVDQRTRSANLRKVVKEAEISIDQYIKDFETQIEEANKDLPKPPAASGK